MMATEENCGWAGVTGPEDRGAVGTLGRGDGFLGWGPTGTSTGAFPPGRSGPSPAREDNTCFIRLCAGRDKNTSFLVSENHGKLFTHTKKKERKHTILDFL